MRRRLYRTLGAAERFDFYARDGLRLSYVRHAENMITAGPVVIAPGAGESAYRYEALIADLRTKGFGPIYALEHRGQGYSEGGGQRADLVHTDHFESYVSDFAEFLRGPVRQDLSTYGFVDAPFLIAHSMGGAIANLALTEDPKLARRVAYVAPMMDINTAILNPMHDRVALWAADLLCVAGLCDGLAVGALGRKRRMAIPGVARELQEGIFRRGVTPGWLAESIRATWQIQARAHDHTEPSLMITALRDRLVQSSSLRQYAATAGDCRLLEVDGPHGLHHDDQARGIMVNAIDDFFRH